MTLTKKFYEIYCVQAMALHLDGLDMDTETAIRTWEMLPEEARKELLADVASLSLVGRA